MSQNKSSTDVILNGVALSALLAAPSTPAASAGALLKVSRTLLTQGNMNVATNGSWVTILNHSHTPSDSSSYLDKTLTAIWKLSSQSGSDDAEWSISMFVDNVSQGDRILSTNGNRESGSSSPCFGRYTNSSLTAKTISIRARQIYSADQSLLYNNHGGGLKPNWLYVEEVKR